MYLRLAILTGTGNKARSTSRLYVKLLEIFGIPNAFECVNKMSHKFQDIPDKNAEKNVKASTKAAIENFPERSGPFVVAVTEADSL